NPTRKRKLLEELLHPRDIFALIRIHLRINALQITIRKRSRSPMPRPRNINHVQVILLDQPIQMHPDKRLPRIRPPMPQQPILDVIPAGDLLLLSFQIDAAHQHRSEQSEEHPNSQLNQTTQPEPSHPHAPQSSNPLSPEPQAPSVLSQMRSPFSRRHPSPDSTQ